MEIADDNKDPENFIRSLEFSYVSDTEVRIKEGAKKAKTYTCGEMRFKERSKIWNEFIRILKSPDNLYRVGKAHGAGRKKKKSYDVGQQVLVQINKKLAPFFNDTYQLQLPEKYRVYELIPERKDAPGTYRFKFKIRKHSDDDIERFIALPEGQLISKIEELSEQKRILAKRGDEVAENKLNKINDQLTSTVKIACEKGWLTRNRALSYLNPQEDPLPVESSIKDEDSIQEE